jgi:hypothetical protein
MTAKKPSIVLPADDEPVTKPTNDPGEPANAL